MPDRPKSASKILVRLPRHLHAELKSQAARLDVSLNQLCLQALQSYLRDSAAPPKPKAPFPPLACILESSLGAKLEAVALFGSQARGDATAASDADLLLCLQSGVALTRDLYAEWDRLMEAHPEAMPRALSPHFCLLPAAPENAGSLWFEVAIDGIVLWERTLAVSRFLASVRRYLLAGGRIRRSAYGVPYWVESHAQSQTG